MMASCVVCDVDVMSCRQSWFWWFLLLDQNDVISCASRDIFLKKNRMSGK